VAHVFADFSLKNVFFTEGGIFAAKTVKEPKTSLWCVLPRIRAGEVLVQEYKNKA
jgi:hypothetical protein